ncbi:MAG: DnaJ C-terminal domain-containing protein [Phycisphaerales bacterium]
MANQDYYAEIGVSKTADADQIKQAFRAKARKLHPDVSDDPDAGTKFAQLNEAYEVLSDPEKRAKYDRLGHEQFVSGRPEGYASAQEVDFGDLGSIIDAMFGGRSGGRGGGFSGGGFGGGFGQRGQPRSRPPRRGNDLKIGLRVTLRDIHQGAKKLISVPKGDGYQSIEVTVPKGLKPEGKLRLRGQGMTSPDQGGTPGDLIIQMHIEKDPVFTRIDDGFDLQVDLPISIAEATLGGKVDVQTIDQKSITLTIPEGTASGTKMRIPGHGLSTADGKRGDLFVNIRIVPPSGAQITDTLRQALTELKSLDAGESATEPNPGASGSNKKESSGKS